MTCIHSKRAVATDYRQEIARTQLEIAVPPRVMALLREVRRRISRMEGRHVSQSEAIVIMCRWYVDRYGGRAAPGGIHVTAANPGAGRTSCVAGGTAGQDEDGLV